MKLGDINSVRADPGSKLDSLEAVKADVLIQQVLQRARPGRWVSPAAA